MRDYWKWSVCRCDLGSAKCLLEIQDDQSTLCFTQLYLEACLVCSEANQSGEWKHLTSRPSCVRLVTLGDRRLHFKAGIVLVFTVTYLTLCHSHLSLCCNITVRINANSTWIQSLRYSLNHLLLCYLFKSLSICLSAFYLASNKSTYS